MSCDIYDILYQKRMLIFTFIFHNFQKKIYSREAQTKVVCNNTHNQVFEYLNIVCMIQQTPLGNTLRISTSVLKFRIKISIAQNRCVKKN